MRIIPDRRLVSLFLLMLAAALSGWWLYGRDDDAGTERAPVASEFDYSMAGFRLVEMDAEGIRKHTLHAENLYHYPDSGHSTMTRPRLRTYDDQRETWEISAEEGVIYDSDRSIFLEGQVHVQYTAVSENQDFEIFTETLQVWPDQEKAETGALVTIVEQAGVTRSKGMRAVLDERRIHLLSEVRGSYEP